MLEAPEDFGGAFRNKPSPASPLSLTFCNRHPASDDYGGRRHSIAQARAEIRNMSGR